MGQPQGLGHGPDGDCSLCADPRYRRGFIGKRGFRRHQPAVYFHMDLDGPTNPPHLDIARTIARLQLDDGSPADPVCHAGYICRKIGGHRAPLPP